MARAFLQFPEQSRNKLSEKNASTLLSGVSTRARSGLYMQNLQTERLLNQRRSKRYVEEMKRLDAGEHMHNEKQVEELVGLIREELPEVEPEMKPVGIVAKCYLGAPYEVHTLDPVGQIIEHYETYRRMPAMLEKARRLAASGHYAFIEVYRTSLRAVKEDGTVAVLKE